MSIEYENKINPLECKKEDINSQIIEINALMQQADNRKSLLERYKHIDTQTTEIADTFIEYIDIGVKGDDGNRNVVIN